MRVPRSVKLATLCVFGVGILTSVARASDGDIPDPFCNARVATATSDRGYKHPPRDIRRVQARLTKQGIKSVLSLLDRPPDLKHHTITDWFLDVYPPDAAKARHLVEEAKQQGLHVEPDYTPPKPVLQ